jgi:SAM-dependent methyltransferase
MDRSDILREFARKEHRGVEIGPYFAPMVPKSEGWNILVLDVFDGTTLRERAPADPNVPANEICRIEEVDLVGSATRIGELVAARGEAGQIDFILSSHNFEHLPNPIAFLRACSEVLRPGGILSMAIPDKRTSFDYFRPISTLGAMLEAFVENRERPTATQLLEMQTLQSRYRTAAGDAAGFDLADDPRRVVALHMMEEAHTAWKARVAKGSNSGVYEDCHCWTFTPASFRLLLMDLRFLGYLEVEPVKVYETLGNEFFVHLRNTRGTAASPLSAIDYYEERQNLLHSVNWEPSVNAVGRDGSVEPASPTGDPAGASAELVALRAETGRLLEQTQLLHQTVERLLSSGGDGETLRQEIHRRDREWEVLDCEIRALRNSRSWRATAPLRFLGGVLRRGR